MKRLEGRVALITGAGSGIGAAVARVFAEDGAAVGVLDIDSTRARDVARHIAGVGGEAMALTADVSVFDQFDAVVQQILHRYARIDILVNNAAVQIMGPLHVFEEEDFDRVLAVNLKGSFNGCRSVLPTFMQQGRGVILFTSSVLGLVADPDLAVYGATKAGMLALMRSVALAYGSHGIRAVAVCPGDVETPLVAEYFRFQPDPDAARQAVSQHYPLGRIARPEEVAKVLAFLASDDASFVSGSSVIVDGGLLANVY